MMNLIIYIPMIQVINNKQTNLKINSFKEFNITILHNNNSNQCIIR